MPDTDEYQIKASWAGKLMPASLSSSENLENGRGG